VTGDDDVSRKPLAERLVIEWGKIILLALSIVGGFVLVILAIVTMQADDPRFAPTLAIGSAQIAGAIGYLTGNGRLAAAGQASVPAIGAPPARLAATATVATELAAEPTERLERRRRVFLAIPPDDLAGTDLAELAAITLELDRRQVRQGP
jgi:hypothetical protein